MKCYETKIEGVVLRDVTKEDVAYISEAVCRMAEFEKLGDEAVLDEATLQKSVDAGDCTALVLEKEGRRLGYVLYFFNFSSFLGKKGMYLEEIFIEDEHRRSGLGVAVMEVLMRIALEEGCERFEWVCLDWNESARSFYEMLGAQPMEGWILYRLTGDSMRAFLKGEA